MNVLTSEIFITGAAKTTGVMGWPVNHSLSPLMHRYWLDQYHIDGVYIPLLVAPNDLAAAIEGIKALGFSGVNVTAPHKVAVIPFLDGLSEKAIQIGAVNLIVNRNGLLWGDNTDGDGFLSDLLAKGVCPKNVLLLGAGGAAQAVAHALLSHSRLESLTIANRNIERARSLQSWAENIFRDISGLAVRDLSGIGPDLGDFDLIVNTTSPGMTEHQAWDFKSMGPKGFVYDLTYNPLETPLLACARQAGLGTGNGLGMLIEQARPAFAAWFSLLPETDRHLRAFLEKALGQQ